MYRGPSPDSVLRQSGRIYRKFELQALQTSLRMNSWQRFHGGSEFCLVALD